MAESESKKLLLKTRRENGLCVQCGADAKGKSRCQSCADKAKLSRKKTQDKKKAAGICQNSGCHTAAMPGATVCKSCSQKASEHASNRYFRNKDAGVCPTCNRKSAKDLPLPNDNQ